LPTEAHALAWDRPPTGIAAAGHPTEKVNRHGNRRPDVLER